MVVRDVGTDGPPGGSPLSLLPSANGILSLDEVLEARPAPASFWATGSAPPWVDDCGEDDHGKWVTFSVEASDGRTVSQRMRWVPPGRFLMGSPETEPGRWRRREPAP